MKTKKPVLKFRTVILSDVHLGAPDCQIDKVNHFLKHTRCEKLILNGDIIDGWSLGRKGGWTRHHTRFVRHVLKMIDKRHTEVIYLRGNHDDILDRFLPLEFGSLRIVDHYIHETANNGDYLVVHGDVFDTITQNTRFIAIAGDIGYQTLLRINRNYNRYRAWRGKEYFSLSKAIKSRTKTVVNYISRFEEQVEAFAKRYHCKGFICGHIHTPDDKFIGSVHYLNSGDWIESNTALVEHLDGRFEILHYDEFVRRLEDISSTPSPTATAIIEFEDDSAEDEDFSGILPETLIRYR